MDKFCETHPKLESLHFTSEDFDDDPNLPMVLKPGNWKLLNLKDLIYQCSYPNKGTFAI